MSSQFDNPASASLEARVSAKKQSRKSVYASNGARALAYTVDHLIITLLSVVFAFGINVFFPAPPFEIIPPALQVTFDASGMPTPYVGQIPSRDEAMVMILEHWVSQLDNFKPLFLLSILLPLVYFSMFAASKRQATPGMRMFKIIITDRFGNTLSLVHAVWRTLAHFLTFFTLGLGFFAANFNKRHLALHDWLSKSEVRKLDVNFQAERARRTEAAREEALTQKARAASVDGRQSQKPNGGATGKAKGRPNKDGPHKDGPHKDGPRKRKTATKPKSAQQSKKPA